MCNNLFVLVLILVVVIGRIKRGEISRQHLFSGWDLVHLIVVAMQSAAVQVELRLLPRIRGALSLGGRGRPGGGLLCSFPFDAYRVGGPL